jgi:hypothetical protein
MEAKSCPEFRAEEVPLLIVDPPGQEQLLQMASTNKCLAQSNKSGTGSKATKKRRSLPAMSQR